VSKQKQKHLFLKIYNDSKFSKSKSKESGFFVGVAE
jgi:hypothetical protein